uniref:Uncharacterized protein n=1 Tax=Arundo donax TaxID=35708 RepID=A0A0A8XSU6_ARUDO
MLLRFTTRFHTKNGRKYKPYDRVMLLRFTSHPFYTLTRRARARRSPLVCDIVPYFSLCGLTVLLYPRDLW